MPSPSFLLHLLGKVRPAGRREPPFTDVHDDGLDREGFADRLAGGGYDHGEVTHIWLCLPEDGRMVDVTADILRLAVDRYERNGDRVCSSLHHALDGLGIGYEAADMRRAA